MRYTVDTHALNVGADRVARALEALTTVRIDDDLRPVAVAVAGGRTTAGLKAVTNLWDVQLAGARDRLRVLGSALVEAADGYGGLESMTAEQFGSAASGAP